MGLQYVSKLAHMWGDWSLRRSSRLSHENFFAFFYFGFRPSFCRIRSGPDRGAYMHKDFVRWEEPLSITSMSKDTNRKRRFSLRKVGISAEEIWEPKKDIKPQIIEVIRKVPPPNENCKKNVQILNKVRK